MKGKVKKKETPASGKGLIIVESPAKARTLKKYLGSNFDVKASVGHIKDLPKSSLGVDLENDFAPTYEIIKSKKKVVEEITKAAAKAPNIYLASDPDREGEAIAWHVADEIKGSKSKIHRVLFHEITKPAVLKALETPEPLNRDRFESQQARRVLDRLVGYKISPLLWIKVRRGLSAGRVQSVAVRIIVEREREIAAFVPKAYWTILALLEAGAEKQFAARLVKVGEEKIDRLGIEQEARAKTIVESARSASWKIVSITQKQKLRHPYPPFITSTLQQEASKKLYFSAKKTMRIAQQLYEGIELGKEGAQGLITYMRTDSTRLSDEAVRDARKIISKMFGKDYVPDAPNIYKNRKGAQDAHEAVRPTSLVFDPLYVKPYLDADQCKLYDLIWKRFLACQMSAAVFDQTAVDLEAKGTDGAVYGFRANGSVLRFPGFLTLWQTEEDQEDQGGLPVLSESTPITCRDVTGEQHFTQPPGRFSESSLIKELEEQGIGRPSTYAAILFTIQDRKYVEKKENRFYPTELGSLVNDLLVENFADVLDIQFTATMEDELDQIEEGKRHWVDTLRGFYSPFEKDLKAAAKSMRNVKGEETPTDLSCPKCKKPLVIKWGKNGKFVACRGYPECRFTSEFTKEGTRVTLVAQPVTSEKCASCGAPMVVKTGRFGRFLACSAYPECKTTKAITTGIACPECGQGELSEKKTRFGKMFYSCTKYPTCKYALWDKPRKTSCPSCGHPFLVEKFSKKEGASIRCPNQECGYRESSEQSPPIPGANVA